MSITHENQSLANKYKTTAIFYDLLDAPWERYYKKWRPLILADVHGEVLEAGVGTGRNLPFYHPDVHLTGIELSEAMLERARKRSTLASCQLNLYQDDATIMSTLQDGSFDWIISTFMCCVMPNELQPKALDQFARVLKTGGRFRILEMIYSKDPAIFKRQKLFAPFVEKVYGAKFDRKTLEFIHQNPTLEVIDTKFLKDDVYLLIDGKKI